MLFWICPIHFPEHPEQTRTEQTPCSVRVRLEQNFLGSLLVRFGSFRTMALFCSASNRTNRTNSNLHCSASHLCVEYTPIGKNWVRRFLHRHSELSSVTPRTIDVSQIKAATPEAISHWFDELRRVIDKYHILPSNTYNMDESGFPIDEIEALRNAGRPVLVGTTSVEVSELLSKMLQVKKIPHNVLNAKQHSREAQIVAEAGLPGAITIATNMAGRGTDIKLGPGVKEAGGLAIIGTERHDSRRVDRQLRGRAGRQGDPGTSQFYVALEDDLMRMFGSERIAKIMDKLGYKEGEVIQHSMITSSIERAQKKVEENNFGIRKRLLEYDDVMNKQRNVVYGKRQHALFGERLALDIDNAFSVVAEGLIATYREQEDYEGFKLDCIVNFGMDTKIEKEEFLKADENSLIEKLYNEATENYDRKKEELKKQSLPVFKNIRVSQGNHIENVVVPFSDGRKIINVLTNLQKTLETGGQELCDALERHITLSVIDDSWKEHLRAMDDLKQSVQTAYLEQKDPLVIYKMEAFNLFKNMDSETNRNIVSFMCHAALPQQEQQAPLREGHREKTDLSKLKANKEEIDTAGQDYAANEKDYYDPSGAAVKQQPVKVAPKIGRNDLCPCGSGKKYKNCHGAG